MNEEEIRAKVRDEILSGLKFETFKGAHITTAICVTVIVDEGASGTQAVCRFFLPNGTFIGEVPAESIINKDNT